MMSMAGMNPGTLVRLHFPIEPDADGFPPFAEETLWAELLEDGSYRLDNIPFFAKGVSLNDIVRVRREGQRLFFSDVKQRSGHSTIRMVIFDAERVPEVRAQLERLGTRSELSHLPKLISVDIPPSAEWRSFKDFIQDGFNRDLWDYEEAAIAHREPTG